MLVLVAYTFFAFAGPIETKKRVLIITGVATLQWANEFIFILKRAE